MHKELSYNSCIFSYLVFKVPTELDVINIQFLGEKVEAQWDCDFISHITGKSQRQDSNIGSLSPDSVPS